MGGRLARPFALTFRFAFYEFPQNGRGGVRLVSLLFLEKGGMPVGMVRGNQKETNHLKGPAPKFMRTTQTSTRIWGNLGIHVKEATRHGGVISPSPAEKQEASLRVSQ